MDEEMLMIGKLDEEYTDTLFLIFLYTFHIIEKYKLELILFDPCFLSLSLSSLSQLDLIIGFPTLENLPFIYFSLTL